MENWNETKKSLSPKDGDDILDLKIKEAKCLLMLKGYEEKKEEQLSMIAEQTRIDDILDHHKIYKIIEDLGYELMVVKEMVEIRIMELERQTV